jgi:hypothetical protein
MNETNVTLAILARGWQTYQDRLSSALARAQLSRYAAFRDLAWPNLAASM